MARYNQFIYNQAKYGITTPAEPEGAPFTWAFLVDWNGDGSYDGSNEAKRIIGYSMQRGRRNYVAPDGGGFEHMRPDTVTLTMDNHDRRYDPRNAASPLYPHVFPGKKCQIAVYDNSTSPRDRYVRFTGYVDDISPITGRTKDVQIICKGNLQVLTDQNFTSPESHLKTTIHQAFVDLLKETGFPAGKKVDADSQPIELFIVKNSGAGKVASDLADASLGQFFINVNGKACFYARNHSYSSAMTIDEDYIQKEFVIRQPWDGVFNQTGINRRKQVKQAQSILFFLPNPIEIPFEETVTLSPTWEMASDIVKPSTVRQLQPGKTLAESPRTLEAYQYKDGTGMDLSGSVIISDWSIGPTGGSVTLETLNHCWLTKFEIRGRLWKEVVDEYNYNSAARYGNRRFFLDSPWMQDSNYANSFMTTVGDFLKEDREDLTIQVTNRADFFALDLLNKVHFDSATFDIDEDYWILGIDEDWSEPTGQEVVTTFHLSKIITDSTSITPADVEVEEGTPEGFGDATGTDNFSSLPIYHNDEFVGNAEELNFLDSDYSP